MVSALNPPNAEFSFARFQAAAEGNTELPSVYSFHMQYFLHLTNICSKPVLLVLVLVLLGNTRALHLPLVQLRYLANHPPQPPLLQLRKAADLRLGRRPPPDPMNPRAAAPHRP